MNMRDQGYVITIFNNSNDKEKYFSHYEKFYTEVNGTKVPLVDFVDTDDINQALFFTSFTEAQNVCKMLQSHYNFPVATTNANLVLHTWGIVAVDVLGSDEFERIGLIWSTTA